MEVTLFRTSFFETNISSLMKLLHQLDLDQTKLEKLFIFKVVLKQKLKMKIQSFRL